VWVLVALAVSVTAEQGLKAAQVDPLPSAGQNQEWQLVWHDEFAGKEIDTSKWESPEYERRGHLWRAANAYVDGKGHLIMKTSKEGDRFASPCLRTINRYEKKYGLFVARCKLPKTQGHWSAFWLYNGSVGKVGNEGRDGTEIDIMEWPYRDGRVQHALHWDGYGKAHKSKGHVSKNPALLDGEFHTFALAWSPEEYVFFVDNKETWRTKAGGVCQVPLYIKLSVEIGKWAGDITKAKLPDFFAVDYVRVYDAVDRDKASLSFGQGLSPWLCHLDDPDQCLQDVWQIDKDVLICKGTPLGYLYTQQDYRDFRLSLEWRWPPKGKPGKGGVLIRTTGKHGIWPKSLEAQINAGDAGDFWGLAGYGLSGPSARMQTLTHEQFGRLTNLKKTTALEKAPGQWNSYEIIAKGETVVLRINGEEVNRASGCELDPGKICLTSEGNEIHFRNIVLTAEAN
jgi:beta-glucanase (GH16 family)